MNSKFETNWCNLPNEMRMECINRMDFKSRMQLRATSKQDKLLVESAKKYKFDNLYVTLDLFRGLYISGKKSKLYPKKTNSIWNERPTPEQFEEAEQLFIQILKFSTAETIDFDSNFETDEAVSSFLANFTDSMTFRFKKIALCCNKLKIVQFFLKKCESAETVQILRPLYGIYGPEFMNILQQPVIINTKAIELMNLEAPETLYQLINNWLKKDDLELGKTVKTCYCSNELIDFLTGKFENRVVSETQETLRIRSNDAKKHILINWSTRYLGLFVSARVIPSDEK